jgi:hypothetical protein
LNLQVGAFFMINLCLVVIATQFAETKRRETERMIAERAKFKSEQSLSEAFGYMQRTKLPSGIGVSDGDSHSDGGNDSIYAAMIKYIGHLVRKARRKMHAWWTARREHKKNASVAVGIDASTAGDLPLHHHHHRRKPRNVTVRMADEDATAMLSSPHAEGSLRRHRHRHRRRTSAGAGNTAMVVSATTVTVLAEEAAAAHATQPTTRSAHVHKQDTATSVDGKLVRKHLQSNNLLQTVDGTHTVPATRNVARRSSTLSSNRASPVEHSGDETDNESSSSSSSSSCYDNDDADEATRLAENNNLKMNYDDQQMGEISVRLNEELRAGWCERLQTSVKQFVDGDHFTRGILVAILINTLSMGIEYHNQVRRRVMCTPKTTPFQPETLTQILEMSNLFFTSLFALEMVLKIVGEGPFKYMSDGFNMFDGSIVILRCVPRGVGRHINGESCSVVELAQGGESGLSVLRTFRLLRILKLVRFMPALRYQLVVMLRTMDNVTVFFGLLGLFIFIFRCVVVVYLFHPPRTNTGAPGE